jgi:hypothetical protein
MRRNVDVVVCVADLCRAEGITKGARSLRRLRERALPGEHAQLVVLCTNHKLILPFVCACSGLRQGHSGEARELREESTMLRKKEK